MKNPYHEQGWTLVKVQALPLAGSDEAYIGVFDTPGGWRTHQIVKRSARQYAAAAWHLIDVRSNGKQRPAWFVTLHGRRDLAEKSAIGYGSGDLVLSVVEITRGGAT